MSINYDYSVHIGFYFSPDELMGAFGVRVEGKYHYEDRYDPKTGKKISEEKVWDEHPYSYYEINGNKFENGFDDLIPYLEEHLSCLVDYTGCFVTGDMFFVFSLSGASTEDKIITDVSSVDDLISLKPRLDKLKEELIFLGLKPSEPKVFLVERSG